jgi:Outer membrane lipoprotein-sorting protein
MVKKHLSGLALAFLLLPVARAAAGELKPSGKKIMDDWDARNQLVDEIVEGTTHVYKKFKLMGKKVNINEKRRTTTWTLRYGKNNLASVLRYHSPKDFENLSVLSYKDTGYANKYVVWQWDPDKKPRGQLKQMVGPLSLDSKTNSFAGTDFTFEDLEPEDLDSCLYRHIKDEKLKHPHDKKLDGTDCYVVEAYKRPGHGKTGYFKRVVWVSKKRYLGLKTTFYDLRTRKLTKTLWTWNFVKVKPKVWRANKSEMKWHNGKTWTRMTISKRQSDPGIPRWFFQPQILKLTDGKSMKLLREMWKDWHRVEKLKKERDALKKKLAKLKKKGGEK